MWVYGPCQGRKVLVFKITPTTLYPFVSHGTLHPGLSSVVRCRLVLRYGSGSNPTSAPEEIERGRTFQTRSRSFLGDSKDPVPYCPWFDRKFLKLNFDKYSVVSYPLWLSRLRGILPSYFWNLYDLYLSPSSFSQFWFLVQLFCILLSKVSTRKGRLRKS